MLFDFSLLPEAAERYVVVASRGKFDEEAVEQALHVQSAYVGLVASNKRGQEIRRSLERKGEPAEKLATVHVPAGLNIRGRDVGGNCLEHHGRDCFPEKKKRNE